MGVLLLDLLPFLERLPRSEGTGLDLRDPDGVLPGFPRPDDEPDTDLDGVCPALNSPGPTNPCPAIDWAADGPNGDQGSFVKTRPIHVLVKKASRSRASRRFSNAARYFSYESRKDRSTFDENINSPLGLVLGGIDGIGTEEAFRLDMEE